MPKFKALSRIQHGEEGIDENGVITNTVYTFPVGAVVEGLSTSVMAKLWDAGVLEQVAEVEAPSVTVTTTSTNPAAPDDSVDSSSASNGGAA